MDRPIVGFHLDEEQDWVADLDCGHGQHVRHQPPFFERPWVMSEAGREEKLGSFLNCLRCDSFEIPDGYEQYKQTPVFNNQTLPRGLRASHTTKKGVWAQIHMKKGSLTYVVEEPLRCEFDLTPDQPGIVVPQVPHYLQLEEDMEVSVSFWRKPN